MTLLRPTITRVSEVVTVLTRCFAEREPCTMSWPLLAGSLVCRLPARPSRCLLSRPSLFRRLLGRCLCLMTLCARICPHGLEQNLSSMCQRTGRPHCRPRQSCRSTGRPHCRPPQSCTSASKPVATYKGMLLYKAYTNNGFNISFSCEVRVVRTLGEQALFSKLHARVNNTMLLRLMNAVVTLEFVVEQNLFAGSSDHVDGASSRARMATLNLILQGTLNRTGISPHKI